ncbi:hypothetical protein F4802DRAFT_574710 [Xylaria palmicola]|nr:hypothetical protein F4802DRAFT_574710 [Xylaria palmicola]
MASTIPQCRGFTHPLVLLVRSTLRSRSFLKSSTRITTTSPCLLINPARYRRDFSSYQALRNKTSKPPATSKKPASLADQIKNFSYAQRLAMKGHPTTLYEAAPQTGFLISSYCASFFCFGSAAINSWFNVYNLPLGIPSWVPVGFSAMSFLFAVLGTVFALRPSSVIRSITLLPAKTSSQTPAPVASRVMLEVAVRRLAPIPLPLKRIRVAPDNVTLVNRMQHRPLILSREEHAARKLADAKRRKKEREYELDHIMTAPFRDARKASYSLFGNIRRGLTGEGFAPVFINGIRYKLDIDGGYALENGQVLDRLVKFQPDPRLARIQSEAKA